MFAKKKKKPEISAPTNFQHRVHTGFDTSNNKFVGADISGFFFFLANILLVL